MKNGGIYILKISFIIYTYLSFFIFFSEYIKISFTTSSIPPTSERVLL
nr:MAG TPA: hypothetical protein [Caudoviricetes sp.]